MNLVKFRAVLNHLIPAIRQLSPALVWMIEWQVQF